MPRQLDRVGQPPVMRGGPRSATNMSSSSLSGIDHITNPQLFKGMAFTLRERQMLGIHGLLPPRVKTQAEQVDNCLRNVRRFDDPLNKYVYLLDLLERNERLFYKLLVENVEELMPIVYTPTVGLACQKFGFSFRRPQGLFITIHDGGHVYEVLSNWPQSDVRAIVVTDGERILGLGDLGAHGMGIPVGKLALYTALAGIKPHQLLPITLDVGTNNKELLEDPDYVGLKHERVRGEQYDNFLQEFMEAVVERFGQNTLIQFEDFGNANAFRLLHTYRNKYCTFNDDIQGTAAVALAGILASLKATNTNLSDHVFLFQGAGEAAIGIAELIAKALEKREGLSRSEALSKIWMKDSRGLIVKNRPEGGISEHKAPFAHEHAPIKELEDIVEAIKPTAIIGVAAVAGAFTSRVLQLMASQNAQPIIFALSNPTHKAECTAEQAYTETQGKCVFASGSPFPALVVNGKRLEPGQGNNSYIFPGVSLGVIFAGIKHIADTVFLEAAEALAELVTDDDLKVGRVYPHMSRIRECSLQIAARVAQSAYKDGMASVYPEPEDKLEFIKAQLYDVEYDDVDALPATYDWPPQAMAK